MHFSNPGQTSMKLFIYVPFMVLLIVLCLCPGNARAHEEEAGPAVSVRPLREAADDIPVIEAGLAGKNDISRYAQMKPAEKQEAAPLQPGNKASSPAASDEYGDVTSEELGLTPKNQGSPDEYGDIASEDVPAGAEEVYDPIRPFNTAMYHFNDKLYFGVWKPVSTGYKYAVPEEFRGLFLNFYENLKAPVRIINNLLQGDLKHAGTEFASLLINTTVGVGGLRNCAQECFGIQRDDADFGQTLGKWGFGYGFYLVLPFLGPSNVRDTVGFLGDYPLKPTSYLGPEYLNEYAVGLFVHERVNYTSFHLGEYEALKNAAIDPYVAMRDAYMQYRNHLIQKH
jgi:phospholipid-binding lipoprotein MlaA